MKPKHVEGPPNSKTRGCSPWQLVLVTLSGNLCLFWGSSGFMGFLFIPLCQKTSQTPSKSRVCLFKSGPFHPFPEIRTALDPPSPASLWTLAVNRAFPRATGQQPDPQSRTVPRGDRREHPRCQEGARGNAGVEVSCAKGVERHTFFGFGPPTMRTVFLLVCQGAHTHTRIGRHRK